MRYILNFNPQAAALLGRYHSALEVVKASNKRLGARTAVRATYDSDAPAFSPEKPGSNVFKTRLNVKAARAAGIRGSQRYTLKRRGKSDTFYLVPHSQVRGGKRVVIDGPAVTVSITERS